MRHFLEIEKVIQRSPLGLRFLDLVQGVTISDGLLVTARTNGMSDPRQSPVVSPLSGIYSFHSLPGLRRFEIGELPASYWCDPPAVTGKLAPYQLTDLSTRHNLVSADESPTAANFIIFVEDRFNRFLPQVMLMCLPRERLVEVPLFSSTARPAPVGLGVVRGELATHDGVTYTGSAGWAMVTITVEDRTYTGIADARGMFNIFVPYASALPALSGGATFPHGDKLVDQLTWPVTLRIFYQPSRLRFLPGLVPPDTLSILEQGKAKISEEVGNPLTEMASMIRFGGDLIVKTKGQPRLFIDAATG